MATLNNPGRVVVLNGVPRSGKSSIAAVMLEAGPGWISLGVDSAMASTPPALQPGIGLRPGGERPDLEPFIQASYDELFASVANECRAGRTVVVDVGIHDRYSQPLAIWTTMLERFHSFAPLLVGVRCSLDVLRQRRAATGYLSWEHGEAVPEPVTRWQHAVHENKVYDIVVDTSHNTAVECARQIHTHLGSR